ncbi:MAG: hypothetical protein JWP89_872 [Schlesneria sp.]|nr:hypothetical protein [Schlesneria sp.]
MTAAINTKSNLNSVVFREIAAVLGIDYSQFATREKLIDEKLLAHRNKIAHGQYLAVEFDEYVALHGEILEMMQEFHDQIENLAMRKAFRSAAASPAQ